ncbi:MAG TPA: thioredoxin family protein [Spirochaetia bacterium]|nr:thioredoxin family protein [Spirochaetia bacterium]
MPAPVPRAALACAVLLLHVLPSVAFSQAVRAGTVESTLITQGESIQPGKPFLAGVRFRMDPGWHIYWKNPGDTGLPTTVAWELPPGFKAGALQWPSPQRFVSQGAASYGYTGAVSLLVEITPPAALPTGTRLTLRARVGWLACRIECTPGKADLSVSLPVRSQASRPDSRWAADFKDAQDRLPLSVPASNAKADRAGGKVVLTVSGLPAAPGSRAFFLPESSGMISDSAEQTSEVTTSQVTVRLASSDGAPPLQRLRGVLLLQGPGSSRGYEIDAGLAPLPAQSGAAGGLGFLAALALAFLGGIILNLMPCVLPVVSLKVLSFVRNSGEGRASAIRHALLFAAGVVLSFWVIAGVLIALRAAGQLIGWGFQFQSPVVVTVTSTLFFVIALNLLGVFEIRTPFAAAAGGLAQRRGALGSFLNGLLATAVATPCTAPFMGSALGYALSQPPAVSLGVFTALGAGMAAPYLVLSAIPGLIVRIPKPGPWMDTLRQVLAFPMLGAVVWTVWVLQALAGIAAVPVLLSTLLAVGLGAWIYGKWGSISRSVKSRVIAGALAAVLVFGGTTAASISLAAQAKVPDPSGSSWEPWSPERQAALVATGVPVFVDFSAQWCLTCQVNERVALENPAVRERFRELQAATLRADWTDRNDTIARALAGFGRAGVPLYVLYRAGSSDPIVLPEILTPGIVLDALAHAGR